MDKKIKTKNQIDTKEEMVPNSTPVNPKVIQIYLPDQHIDPSNFHGRISEQQLAHLASCPKCSNTLAGYVEQQELLKAPPRLKSSIMERSRALDVQIVAGSNHLSAKLQMFYYSLKVAAAVACSLALLLAVPELTPKITQAAVQPPRSGAAESEHWVYYETVNNFTEQLNKLMNYNTEVFQHDKEKR